MTRTQRLVYVAKTRLPTEKAPGYQITKMCEAFARSGAEVSLLHPYRYQRDARMRNASVLDYYGVSSNFRVRTLKNIDILRLESVIPSKIFLAMYFAHGLLWGLYAADVARKQHAAVYYTRTEEVAFWLVRLGLRTVFEAHGVPKRGKRWLLRRTVSNPGLHLTVAVTSFIKERFVQLGAPEERVAVLPDCVDLEDFEGLPSREECRQKLGLPADRPIVGYVGRFQTRGGEKGVPELVRAMGYLGPRDGRDHLLLCVGGPMEAVPDYLSLASELGVPHSSTRFVDRVPNSEVPYWIRACDVVTIPWPWTEHSAYYTSPLKLFEYMVAGVPIVASDLPSLRDVLTHDANAWLVEPGNPEALASGIDRMLSDGRRADSIAGQARRDAQQYTWVNRAEQILELLDSR